MLFIIQSQFTGIVSERISSSTDKNNHVDTSSVIKCVVYCSESWEDTYIINWFIQDDECCLSLKDSKTTDGSVQVEIQLNGLDDENAN